LRHKDTIEAKKRVAFEIDFAWIGQDYSYGKRTHRSIKNSRVSWIYLHGMELASKENKDKHWTCKLCYEASKPKVLVASSTASASRHLLTHDLYPPGKRPINNTVDAWVEGVHPLQAERWREHFIDWITHDDITFE
jgi:hypothetical protein